MGFGLSIHTQISSNYIILFLSKRYIESHLISFLLLFLDLICEMFFIYSVLY